MKSPAVFLDRDDTIMEDRGYIADPDEVCLLPGAAEAVRRFTHAGHLVVVVSNQSGIARGLFTEKELTAVHARLEELLGTAGAHLNGAYYCPYLAGPEATVKAYQRDSELRKPRPGMLLQAAEEMDIDLSHSWMIGDSLRDVQAGAAAGCRTILLTGDDSRPYDSDVIPTHTARDLLEAADLVESGMDRKPERHPRRPSENTDEVVELLAKIHNQLDQARRQDRQQDFSVIRLFAALLQMFAIVAALWGFVCLLDGRSEVATARLLLACFLQLAAVSAFAIDRFR